MPNPDYQHYTSLMRAGHFREAAGYAEKQALNAALNPGFWLTQQSRALLRANDTAGALEAAGAALRASPASGWAVLARADALLRAGKPAEALSDYESALADPQVGERALDGLLQALDRSGGWERMLALCDSGGLEEIRRLRYRARALAGLGRDEEALAACRAGLGERPDDPAILWTLTDLQVRSEGLEVVLAQMSRLARIPGKPPVYREIYASLCRKAGRHDSAADLYRSIASGGDLRISRRQAFALAKSGGEAEAIPMMEELLRHDPDDAYVHSAYIAACRRSQALERADRYYQDLLARYPDHKGIFGRIRRVRKEMAQP